MPTDILPPQQPHLPAPRKPALRLDETLPSSMQQIVLGQHRRIVKGLDPRHEDSDAGVHSARKAMKRIRALMRMVRDEVGHAAYRSENVVLRDTARLLAPVRDSYVMLETLDGLREAYREQLAPGAFATTQRHLFTRYRSARQEVLGDDALMTHVRVTLGAARTRLSRWDASAEEAPASRLAARGMRDDFDVIAPGIRRVYRRGLRGMERAYDEGTPEAFHEWRKRAKYLRYQLEALQPVWPEVIGAHARALDELGELLGNEHDLAVLFDVVRDDEAATADERERTVLLALLYRSRIELQWSARPLAKALYAEQPDQFVSRLGAYYAAARR